MGMLEDMVNYYNGLGSQQSGAGMNTLKDKPAPTQREDNNALYGKIASPTTNISNTSEALADIGNTIATNKKLAQISAGDNTVVGRTNASGIKDMNNTNQGLGNVMNIVNSGSMNKVDSNTSNGTSSMDEYNKKMYHIESRGNPTAVNPKTGAFGLNQILPRYEKYYADKSGQSVAELRTVPGQLKVSKTIYDDTTKYLDKKGYDKTDKNRYIVHQQGRQGFSDLMNGKINHKALAGNIPTKFLMSAPDNEPLDKTYHRYWDSKFASF